MEERLRVGDFRDHAARPLLSHVDGVKICCGAREVKRQARKQVSDIRGYRVADSVLIREGRSVIKQRSDEVFERDPRRRVFKS